MSHLLLAGDIATLLLAATLLVAGLAKLRRPGPASDELMPAWLPRAAIARWHPWVEFILGLLLIALWGWTLQATALLAVLLTVGYLLLVLRAWYSPSEISCDCFGQLGSTPVRGNTVLRNIWLLLVAGLSLFASWSGLPLLERLQYNDVAFGAAIASGLTALHVVLFMHLPREGTSNPADQQGDRLANSDEDDYVRIRTPAVPLELADGTLVTLRQLSAQRAQVLFFVSASCGGCHATAEKVPTWQQELPQLDFRLLTTDAASESPFTRTAEPQSLHDKSKWVRESFGFTGTPAAVLLGVDGYLAGGPVYGNDAVSAFITDIKLELSGS